LPGLNRGDGASDLLDNAAVFVAHRGWLSNRLDAAIRPEVRSANARGRDPDDGIGRLDDFRGLALLETDVARPVQNSSLHDLSPLLRLLNDFVLNHNFRCQHLWRALAGRANLLAKGAIFLEPMCTLSALIRIVVARN